MCWLAPCMAATTISVWITMNKLLWTKSLAVIPWLFLQCQNHKPYMFFTGWSVTKIGTEIHGSQMLNLKPSPLTFHRAPSSVRDLNLSDTWFMTWPDVPEAWPVGNSSAYWNQSRKVQNHLFPSRKAFSCCYNSIYDKPLRNRHWRSLIGSTTMCLASWICGIT